MLAIASARICEKRSGGANGTASAAACDQVGTDVVSAYILTYSAFGVVGAFLADTQFGHARTQLLSALMWLAGMLSLSIVLERSTTLVVVALLFTSAAFGAGWSTLSVFTGHQMPPSNKAFWFSMLYVALNVGDLIAEAGGPLIRQHFSVSVVAWVLTAVLGVSVVVFSVGYRSYSKPLGSSLGGDDSTRETNEAYQLFEEGNNGDCDSDSDLDASSMSILWRTARIFVALPVYFGLFYQQSDTWTFQAQALDRSVGGLFTIPADAMPAVNDMLVIVFLPALTRFFIPAAERRCGRRACLPIQRLAYGIVCVTLAFACAGLLQSAVTRQRQKQQDPLMIWWQVPQYVCVSLAEAFVGSTGLEFAYNEALPKHRALVTSLWFFSAALGQAIILVLPRLFPFLVAAIEVPPEFFFACAVTMLAVLACFLVVTRGYKYRHHSNTD